MLFRTSDGLYQSDTLNQFTWLEHGFGTRHLTAWPSGAVATVKQIHSTTVVETVCSGLAGEGDALVTGEAGLSVAVKTADCVPILLVDKRTRSVAAVHAGWKGSAGAIVQKTVKRMSELYGTETRDLYAAIGPCIQSCCYEVGSEVWVCFVKWLPGVGGVEKQMLDLVEVNQRQLVEAGVAEWKIDRGAPCTACTADDLHSFRRDGSLAGRMLSAIRRMS